MLSVELLVWIAVIGTVINFWWQSDKIKQLALLFVARHCQQQGLQLLDQTMVLKGLRLKRSAEGKLSLQRKYDFEFASTGSERYCGSVILQGRNLEKLELAPHILPDSDNESLH